jgi:hypothetical protein
VLNVKCIRQFGLTPVEVDQTNIVIVEDKFGNPIVVVISYDSNPPHHTVVTADDPDFNRILAGLGIDKVVINEPLRTNFPTPEGNPIRLQGPTRLLQ